MKKLLVATLVLAAGVASAANAQTTYHTYDNGFGNSTTLGSDGSTFHTSNNGGGNSTTLGTFGNNGGNFSAHTYNNGGGNRTTLFNGY